MTGSPIRVALLGSTGSIGRQVLDVLAAAGPDAFRVVAMAAGRDASTFAEQIAGVRPAVVTLADKAALARLALPAGTVADAHPEAMLAFATRPDVDMVVVATGGIVSLRPVLAALGAGKVVATANKETLVAGGHLVMPLAARLAAQVAALRPGDPMASPLAWVRPIDSEHSAIWQCLVGERPDEVQRLLLTASGGPFRTRAASAMASITPAEALGHPTWSMGAKITVDSATLMNKGLEVIEAHWLYDVAYDRIDVLIHPQSLVHSMVEFVDGSLKAQLGLPDMRIPIQYALTYPRRTAGPAPRLDLVTHPTLTFEAPDDARFPLLSLARAAGLVGSRATAALISADEVAVPRFLDGSLGYPGIHELVSGAVARFGTGPQPGLDDLIALDAEVRAWASATDRDGREARAIDGAIDIVLLLAILVGLVVIHELGHFVAARRAGVRVHEFGVGFPPRARVLHRGKETLWTLNWLPIGGFVRLEGEEGESTDARAFVNQPLRTRLLILLAGVGMNFLLAWVIMSLIAGLADPVSTVRVAQVMPGTPAAHIGLVGSGVAGDGTATGTVGDTIVGVDGHTWMVFDDITNADAALAYLRAHAGQVVTISIRHADGSLEDKSVQLRPALTPTYVAGGTVALVPTSALGIVIDRTSYESTTRGVLDAIVTGFHRTVDASTLILRGLGDLISNIGDPQVSGPIGMVSLVGTTRELPPAFMIWLIALLSANLAVVNILPFPPMDGGRMAMAIAQRLAGGRISVNLERTIYFSGFLALMGLLVWISISDVRRLAGG